MVSSLSDSSTYSNIVPSIFRITRLGSTSSVSTWIENRMYGMRNSLWFLSDRPEKLPRSAQLSQRSLNGIRVLQSVFLQLLPVDRVQAQLIERHRQSFLALQIYPVEQRFFRCRNLVRPVPRALFLKPPKQILADVPVDDANRRAME